MRTQLLAVTRTNSGNKRRKRGGREKREAPSKRPADPASPKRPAGNHGAKKKTKGIRKKACGADLDHGPDRLKKQPVPSVGGGKKTKFSSAVQRSEGPGTALAKGRNGGASG